MKYNTNTTNKQMSLWQWIVIYILVGVIVYGIIFYLFFNKGPGYQYPSQIISPTPTITPSGPVNTTKTMFNSSKGNYLADSRGFSLYIFDKDSKGVSTCTGGCANVWPAFKAYSSSATNLPDNITIIQNSDGTMQYAWQEMPLYYYAGDQKIGDTNGDGVGGIWHLVILK